jgi:Fe-S cluster biogenesis protein NfuA
MPAQPDFQQRLQAIEGLLAEIDSAADPSLRTSVQNLVQTVMDLHGAGIERMLELVHASGEAGETVVQKLGRDDLVSSLLILYGLHPVSFEDRIGQALDKLRPKLQAREGDAELLDITEGVVRLRIHANGHGCGSTADALKQMVEDAIYQAAPDIVSLTIDGGEHKNGFVPLASLALVGAEKGGA